MPPSPAAPKEQRRAASPFGRRRCRRLEKVRPLLEVIGGSIHHIGPVGRGQQAKAVNQVLVAGSYAAVAEAIALGQRRCRCHR